MKERSDGTLLVAIYHFAGAALNFLVLCGLLSIPLLVGLSTAANAEPDGAAATAITAIVMVTIGAIFFVLAVANLIVGWGLWRQREWARMGAIALSVIRLINIPIGTVIGGVIIWYLMQDHVKEEFAP